MTLSGECPPPRDAPLLLRGRDSPHRPPMRHPGTSLYLSRLRAWAAKQTKVGALLRAGVTARPASSTPPKNAPPPVRRTIFPGPLTRN